MTCSGRSVGRRLSRTAAAARHLRGSERRPLRLSKLVRAAARIALIGAAREARGQRPGKDRQDLEARRREVVVDRVAVRERGDAARVVHRAHAEDVRKRRRVARVLPRARRRLVGVADRRNDDDAVRDRIGDSVSLEARVGVTVRIERVTDAAEAHVDDASAVVDGPANRPCLRVDRDRARLGHDLRDEQFGRRREARDADPVVDACPDEPGDERAVTERVHARRAADEALRAEDPAREIGMACVDAGVDDRDRDRLERRQRDPRGVEAAVREVPLLRHERIARREREVARENGST